MVSNYNEAVDSLYRRINYERLGAEKYTNNDLKLDRMARLLAALGNPQQSIPAVHVAGTKGKGTTCSLIASCLQAAGYRVGLYTSPHRHRVEERLVVDGQMPSEEQFVDLVNQLLPVLEVLDRQEPQQGPTFFECVNALAWLHFQQSQVDIVVLEVGLGGRLDSTNLCAPLVTTITCIAYDHMQILGNTLREIAGEKAGIIKPGVPLICGATIPEARQRIHEQAERVGVPIRQAGEDFSGSILTPWTPESGTQQIQVELADETVELTVPFPGPVYAENAALAVASLAELRQHGYQVSHEQMKQAAREVKLPLRFEILSRGPFLIADSAHNPASISALTSTLNSVFPQARKTLIMAVSRDKDYAEMCRQLDGIDCVIATRYLGNERALSVPELEQVLQKEFAGKILTAETPELALKLAKQQSSPDEVLVASGSLFLAAEVSQLVQAENSSLSSAIHL